MSTSVEVLANVYIYQCLHLSHCFAIHALKIFSYCLCRVKGAQPRRERGERERETRGCQQVLGERGGGTGSETWSEAWSEASTAMPCASPKTCIAVTCTA